MSITTNSGGNANITANIPSGYQIIGCFVISNVFYFSNVTYYISGDSYWVHIQDVNGAPVINTNIMVSIILVKDMILTS